MDFPAQDGAVITCCSRARGSNGRGAAADAFEVPTAAGALPAPHTNTAQPGQIVKKMAGAEQVLALSG